MNAAGRLLLPLVICAVCLGGNFLVRLQLQEGQGFWVFPPVLYIRHIEHVAAGQPWGTAATAATLLAGILVLRTIQRTARMVSVWPELVLTFAMGGAIANLLEVYSRGSVTDALGVHVAAGGVYSAGDVAIGIGVSMLPAAAFGLVAPARGTIAGLIAGAIAYGSIVLFALVVPRRLGLAFLASGTGIATIAALVARTLIRLREDTKATTS